MARSRTSWVMVAAAVALLVGCHTITEEEGPTEPTAVPQEPTLAAITIPVILPASNPPSVPTPGAGITIPVPGTSPTPAPGTTIPVPGTSPTPTPEPPPPPPSGGSCSLPPGDPNARCSRTSQTFLGDVEEAIDRVVDRNPELFDLNDKVCNTCYRINDHERYVSAVMAQMRNMGYCAYYDGEELAVKNTNSFNDQYDISTSRGFIRRGVGAYRTTCWPAWF